ncbi:gastrula zinc finger protein XlCGF57.1-like isoform X2 [Macrosteles quadrilineatus]|uniref:gastrula zinc finger protein XlCGF57.1-like isoform X2 n=1 Tax=Macrosteles quadrilineatus TaxID=74068 RepID=UPI0023E240C1|nr:gastrula zinc finger protein XlCGF57.1-like isoform X2 [Macrosteles quadrilineatus]
MAQALSIEQYCRVCGLETAGHNLILIYSEDGIGMALEKKIQDHIHLKVKENDCLPQQVCLKCISQLNTFQQFFEASHSAAFKLHQMFLPNKEKEEEDDLCKLENIDIWEGLEPEILDSENPKANDCSINLTDGKNKKVKKTEKKLSSSVLCHVCGKAFKSMTNLHAHKRTHLPENLKKKFQCTICTKSFRTNFHLSEHMNVHQGVTPYNCQECDKQFHSRALLRQHLQVHQQNTKVACPHCGLLCSRKANLRAHMKTHEEGRSFSCSLCKQQFSTYSEMLSHRRQHSQQEIRLLLQQDLITDKDYLITCHFCDKIFTNKRILATHMDKVHGGNSLTVKCGDCGKLLQSQRSLVYHQRSQHSDERPHRCAHCGQGFLLLKLLQAHETKHTGERPFKCDTCGKGFRSRNNLYQHSEKHGGKRKFQCTVCGKHFQRKAALNVHFRIHSGEKSFVCDKCGRGFIQKNDLVKHQKTHEEGNSKAHTCGQCLFVFGSKKELTKHKEETHQEIGVVPLIVTNNMFETHVITEDGQRLVFPTVSRAFEQSDTITTQVTDI